MKKILTTAFLCALAVADMSAARRSNKPVPPRSEARIAEIASYLPAAPSSPADSITDRKHWGKLAEHSSARRFIKKGESILKEDIPVCPDEQYLEFTTTGNRRNYEIPYFKRSSNAMALTMAECLENKGRFIPRLCEYLETICGERSWVMPAHDRKLHAFNGSVDNVDLGAAHRARTCAWIVSVMGDRLPDGISRKVKRELERRIFATYRKNWGKKGGFGPLHWFAGPANWTAVCHCEVVCAALAVIEDRNDRAAFIETAERFLPYFIAGFPEDGYCSEGMGYWNYGWGHYLQIGLTVKQATGGKVNLFSDPKTGTIMKFGTGLQMVEGRAPDFADGGGRVSADALLLGHLQWPDLPVNKAALTDDPFAGGTVGFFLRAFGQLDGLPPRVAGKLPMRTAYPVGQVWVIRPDPESSGMPFCAAVKGGHNAEFHNHNDIGSYAVMLDGVAMSGDPGGTQYTALTFSSKRYTIPLLASYGHPVPVLNGCGQLPGRQYAAKIISTDFTDDVDRVVMDIAGAYPGEAAVSSVVRTFEYDRKGRRFTISDDVTFKTNGLYSVPIMTPGLLKPGAEKGTYTLTAGTKDKTRECDVSVSASGAGWTMAEGERIDNPGRTSPMRYAIMLDRPVEKAVITVSFTPREQTSR